METLAWQAVMMGLGSAGLGLGGFLAGSWVRQARAGRSIQRAEAAARELVATAHRDAAALRRTAALNAKDALLRSQQDGEARLRRAEDDLRARERHLLERAQQADRHGTLVEERTQVVAAREREIRDGLARLARERQDLQRALDEARRMLQRVAGMSREEATTVLLARLERELQSETAAVIRKAEERAAAEAAERARRILVLAMQRCAFGHTAETTVSVVPLPSNEMKGRVIGKEGRNIRAFELVTGIDVIVDEAPEAVVLSGFDPSRREIARVAMERLVADGRIHPARIEEIVAQVQQEVARQTVVEGEGAAQACGLHDLHPELVRLLGGLRYRTSYGQNVLAHVREVASLMGVIAEECGLESAVARRIGLLHDIGKAVSHEQGGSHAAAGAVLARRYGESELVANAIAAHHEEVAPESVHAVLLMAADTCSAARPGARGDSLESYVRRLQQLEGIASSFEGVARSFAVRAGREIRVVVEPTQVDDLGAVSLARNIRRKVEEGVAHPGQVKVTVIRETRAVEYAK